MKQNWVTDVQDWTSIGKDAASFMFTSAEKLLEESVATSEGINKRADRLLTITVALLSVTIGYLIKDANLPGSDPFLTDTAKVLLFPFSFALVFIVRNLFPYEIFTPGASPHTMLRSERFDRTITAEHQYIELVVDQLESYQDRIKMNDKINLRRMNNNMRAQWALISLPAFPFLVFLLNL